MACGHEHPDDCYDHWIKPALEEMPQIPIRVDRIIHNDRNDARLNDELLQPIIKLTLILLSGVGDARGTLLLGVLWTFWHFPDFLTSQQGGGPGTGFDCLPYQPACLSPPG